MRKLSIELPTHTLDLWIKIKERIDAQPQLPLDLLARSFQHMHGHTAFPAAGQFQTGILHALHFAFRHQSQSINQG